MNIGSLGRDAFHRVRAGHDPRPRWTRWNASQMMRGYPENSDYSGGARLLTSRLAPAPPERLRRREGAGMVKDQLNWRSFVDRGAIADEWKPAGTPSYYIIDSKGVIRFKWAGAPGAKAIDWALEKLIQEAKKDAKTPPK